MGILKFRKKYFEGVRVSRSWMYDVSIFRLKVCLVGYVFFKGNNFFRLVVCSFDC